MRERHANAQGVLDPSQGPPGAEQCAVGLPIARAPGPRYGSEVSAAGAEGFEPDEWPVGLPAVSSVVRLTGGWIGRTWQAALTDGRQVVVKQCPYEAAVEVDGLAALATAGVPVPDVLGVAGGTLVLRLVQGPPDWPMLGTAIARMHRHTDRRYGWHRDNRAGRFVQPNSWTEEWPTFFVENRVRPHLADPSVPAAFRLRLERACDGRSRRCCPRTRWPP